VFFQKKKRRSGKMQTVTAAHRFQSLAGGLYGFEVGQLEAVGGKSVRLTVLEVPTLVDASYNLLERGGWVASLHKGEVTLSNPPGPEIVLRRGTRLVVDLRGINAPPESMAKLQELLSTPDSDEVRSALPSRMWVEAVDPVARRPIVLLWTHMQGDISGAMLRAGAARVVETDTDHGSEVPPLYYTMGNQAMKEGWGTWATAASSVGTRQCDHCSCQISQGAAPVGSQHCDLKFCSTDCQAKSPAYRKALLGTD
jgi:hypothetical protein